MKRILICLPILLILMNSVVRAKSSADMELSGALKKLSGHISGKSPMEVGQVNQQAAVIREHMKQVESSSRLIAQALYVSAAFEDKEEPLFMNKATKKGFPRTPAGGLELERAVFEVQQGLIDHAFTSDNLRKYAEVLDGALFKTSAYFPGAVDAPKNPRLVHKVKINASQPECWGIPVMYNEDPARRPTGCYLAPGSIATVKVPRSMVGKGFNIRVGAHSWDLKKKPLIKRLDRVSIIYPIEQVQTRVANPLGGGIYIEVPYEADAGLVQVQIANAVRSPFFSARSFDKTTLKEWEKERRHPGPWTDFESDKFMMQVPTDWIYDYDDPETLLKDWDTALDAVSSLFGYPFIRNKTVLYLQIDVIMRGNANYPGYPQSNTPYNPHKAEKGNNGHWLLKGPQHGGATIFHELGHAQLFTKFKGEVEAVVNLPFVAVLNNGFGIDLDTAFGESFHKETVSLDQAAIMWMVTENFRNGRPMDITNSEKNEVRYQHRGYGKYVEIVHLFGWETLEGFWSSVQDDYLKGIEYARNSDPTENRIMRMSEAAGADLTPLIHFWGVQPEDATALEKEMRNNDLQPSARIYDQLLHYESLIPMNNSDFAEHAEIVNPKGIRKGKNPNFAEGWYYVWKLRYDETHGEEARVALQEIIETYFPEGRPSIQRSKTR
jgi:hypothetical protein